MIFFRLLCSGVLGFVAYIIYGMMLEFIGFIFDKRRNVTPGPVVDCDGINIVAAGLAGYTAHVIFLWTDVFIK